MKIRILENDAPSGVSGVRKSASGYDVRVDDLLIVYAVINDESNYYYLISDISKEPR